MKNDVRGWVLFALTWPMLLGWLWLIGMCLFRRVEWTSLRFQGAGVLVGLRRPLHRISGPSRSLSFRFNDECSGGASSA